MVENLKIVWWTIENAQLNRKTQFLTWFLTFIFRPDPNTMCIVPLWNWWFSTLHFLMAKLKYNVKIHAFNSFTARRKRKCWILYFENTDLSGFREDGPEKKLFIYFSFNYKILIESMIMIKIAASWYLVFFLIRILWLTWSQCYFRKVAIRMETGNSFQVFWFQLKNFDESLEIGFLHYPHVFLV